MAESHDQAGRYPSPGRPAPHGLPFYQQSERRATSSERDAHEPQQQHDETSAPSPGHPVRDAPEDAQLRHHMSNIMGGFGGFANTPVAPADDVSHSNPPSPTVVTQGSSAFAQFNGSPSSHDAGISLSADRRKDKRQKVSRACDECRRKKIRCDAVDETGATPCTNCSRTGAKCAFSRQPMKRGPSKGYIKELADRLHHLERQVQPPHMQEQHQYEVQQLQRAMAEYGQDTRTMHDPRVGEKRSLEMAEALQNGMVPGLPPPANVVPRANMQTPQYPPSPHPPAPGSASGSAQPFWRYGSSETRHDPIATAYDTEAASLTTFDWDEEVIDEYYRFIHQTFPLLPHNKHRLRQRLAECPASLREACLAALDCLVRTFPTTQLPPNAEYAQALKRTAELLAKYPFDNPSSHTNATNLVYLQTLLLMALEVDNHGPATMRGQAGPSRAEWLGRAAGVAGQLEINVIRNNSASVMEGDRDSEERLARRVWWVLFILDRWHASSTADLLKLPENSVVLLPEDQILLGESTYHLARLSFIIGHLAAILTTTKTPSTDVMSPSNPASSLLGLTLAGEIDRFRESVESVWGSLNLVHLSYHHCHLLIKRLNPNVEPSELVGHAVKVATVLNSRLTPVTPLNHHFGALAAMTLCELCDVAESRSEALKGLDQLAEALGEGRGLAGKLQSQGWDGAVRELVKKKREKMQGYQDSLQNLAEAAVGADEATFDPTMLTRYGYLTSLGQGLFARDSV